MGGAFWAGLAAGADTLGKGINTVVEDNKKRKALEEQRTYNEGLLAKANTREDAKLAESKAYEKELYARGRTDKATDTETEFTNTMKRLKKSQQYNKELEGIKQANAVGLLDKGAELDREKIADQNVADIIYNQSQGTGAGTFKKGGKVYKNKTPAAKSNHADFVLTKTDNGDSLLVNKITGETRIVASKNNDPVPVLDQARFDQLSKQFTNEDGTLKENFEDVAEDRINWNPLWNSAEDEQEIQALTADWVAYHVARGVPRARIWKHIPSKYREVVWPNWKLGDRIPIEKGGRSPNSNNVDNILKSMNSRNRAPKNRGQGATSSSIDAVIKTMQNRPKPKPAFDNIHGQMNQR